MCTGLEDTKGVSRACPVPDGATLTFQYRKDPNNADGGYLDTSHVGSCAVWLKKVDNAIYDGAAGDGWFKIWDMGFNNKWCTVKMSDGGGLVSVNLPPGLVGGYYLVRPELLALHNANQGDPQYYISCAQVYIQSSGDLVPARTEPIPGYCRSGDATNTFNVYNGAPYSSFVPPGMAPVSLVNDGKSNDNGPMPEGGRPENCILDVGSWCGLEVPQYHDQDSCWSSHQNCWDQGKGCWDGVFGVMQEHCKIWSGKCEGLKRKCEGGRWNGPQDSGKDLTPPRATINAPPAFGPTRAPSANQGYYNPPPPAYPAPAPAPVPAPTPAPAPPVDPKQGSWWCRWNKCVRAKV